MITCVVIGFTFLTYRLIVNKQMSHDAMHRAYALILGLLTIPPLVKLAQTWNLALCNDCIPDTPAGLAQRKMIPVIIVVLSGTIMVSVRYIVYNLPELRKHIRTRAVATWLMMIFVLIPIGAFVPPALLRKIGIDLQGTTLSSFVIGNAIVTFAIITGWLWFRYRARSSRHNLPNRS